jgi:hypothetical protein
MNREPHWNWVPQTGIRKQRKKYERIAIDPSTTKEGPFGVFRWSMSKRESIDASSHQISPSTLSVAAQELVNSTCNMNTNNQETQKESLTHDKRVRTSIKIHELLNPTTTDL